MKIAQHSNVNGGGGLGRFSDTPKDACLDDLFQPLGKQRDQGTEASSSSSGQQNDLAKELKARMAQKQLGTDHSNGGKLLEIVMNLRDDMIDIDGSVSFLHQVYFIVIKLCLCQPLGLTTSTLSIHAKLCQ